MTSKKKRAFHFGGASWLLLCAMADGALAQDAAAPSASTQLPEITVTAPSPIVRRKPVAPRGRRRASPAPRPARTASARRRAASRAGSAAAPQQGVLPVVTDQFATVTVVPNEEIRRQGTAQLGDLLFSKPGITGSSFAPGASSRPIIRGLDVNRVGIVENGTNAGGASDLGEDHFVPVDPLATNQVEVIRGPAAMRYGSTSIGGVVSATNNRIPDALPTCAAAPFQSYGLPAKAPLANAQSPSCVTVETRTAVSSVDRGVDGGILLDAGGGNFAIHADAYGRKASDYSIPELSVSVRPDPAGQRPAAEFGDAGGWCVDRRLLHLPGRLHRRGDHAERHALSHSRHRRRRSPDPHRRASDQIHGQGRIPAGRGGDRRRHVSGPARPITSTTRSGSPIPPIRRRSACGRPLPTRSRKAASRCR